MCMCVCVRVRVCVTDIATGVDSTTGKGKSARTKSFKASRRRVRPELGCATEVMHTISWVPFPPPVHNSCVYYMEHHSLLLKLKNALSYTCAELFKERESQPLLVYKQHQGLTLIITRFTLSVTQQAFMVFLSIS